MQTPEETLKLGQRAPAATPAGCWCSCCATGAGGALCLGYLIQLTRRQIARRPERHRGGLHRPARLVRGLPARRRLDRPGRHQPACWPAKATSLLACTPSPRAPRRSKAAWTRRGGVFRATTCRSRASTNRRASPNPTPTSSGPRWTMALGDAVTRAGHRRRAPDHGRRADLRGRERPRRARWNTDALGPHQTRLRHGAGHRCATSMANGGFLHFGQGKWYPGEQLPRWALSICWRADGPRWRNPSPVRRRTRDPHPLHQRDDAQGFIQSLRRPGPDRPFIRPATRTPFYYLWRERRLPVNVDPFDSRLDDEMERAPAPRVRAEAGRRSWLPIQPNPHRGPALAGSPLDTGPWFFRDDRMYLIPGDSPMGCRLPLDAALGQQGRLPVPDREDPTPSPGRRRPVAPVARPAGNRTGDAEGGASGAAPPRKPRAQPEPGAHRFTAQSHGPAAAGETGPWITCTALCVEASRPAPRQWPGKRPWRERRAVRVHAAAGTPGGLTWTCWPPIEATAEAIRVRRSCSGLPPPRDPRLKKLQVTPDPA